MTRDSGNWLFTLLGLGLWFAGNFGVRTFDLASWPWLVANLLTTVGLVMFLAVVVIGMWRALEGKP